MDPAFFYKHLAKELQERLTGPFADEKMRIDKSDPSPAIKDELYEVAG